MQGICGLLALDPLLRDIAPNLPATHTIPTFHFGPTEPLCRQNVDIRAGITAVIGIGDGCEKGVPSLCQGVPGVPGRLIAGKLVTNVSTGGGGTHPPVTPLPGDTRTNTHPLLLLLKKGQVHNTSMQFADTEPCAMCSWCVV